MIIRYPRKFIWFVTVILFTAAISQVGSNASAEPRECPSQDPLPEVSVTLSSNGFNPEEVRPPSQRFLLSIDNRSGLSDLVLKLKRADGSQMRELHVSGAGGDWSESFDLSPGTYTLSEANHSTWLCTIIVQ